MLILFLRAIILYSLVFLFIRLTGKRQISDLQPFDLIVTLLIADLAAVPASDIGVPLLYGVVPILALFLIQRVMGFFSLKNEKFRGFICGTPIVLIDNGAVQEAILRDAHYTMNDLIAQLRQKDVFDLNTVAYAILETNGELSVLLKGDAQSPTIAALSLPAPEARPPYLLVSDGKIHRLTLRQAGHEEKWLERQLSDLDGCDPGRYLFVLLLADGSFYAQTIEKFGGKPLRRPAAEGDRA